MDKDVYVIGVMEYVSRAAWPLAKPYLEAALEHSRGELTADDCMTLAAKNEGHIWLIASQNEGRLVGAAFTQNISYGRKSALRIVALGGDRFDEWAAQLDGLICSYAKAEGLDFVELVGRVGWQRKLKPLGYEAVYTICIKELTDGKVSGNDKDDKHNNSAPISTTIH